MSDDRARLEDIWQAAHRIEAFIADADISTFREDKELQSAVIFQLLIIGEGAKHLSEELRSSHDEIPWSKMARMRDRLIRGYFDLDIKIVWTTATRDVPLVIEKLARILD